MDSELHLLKHNIIQSTVNGEYDMKVVWVTNYCDVLDGNVRLVIRPRGV